MSRVLAAVSAAALTLTLSAAGLSEARAAADPGGSLCPGASGSAASDPAQGFTTTRDVQGFVPHSITSPRPGCVVLAGEDQDHHIVVQQQVDGRVISTRLLDATLDGTTLRKVEVFTSGGTVWLFNPFAEDVPGQLWRWDGSDLVAQDLPAMPAGVTSWRFTEVTADGDDIALMAHSSTADGEDPVYVARRSTAGWSVQSYPVEGNPRTVDSIMLTEGHLLAEAGSSRNVFDLSTDPATDLGSPLFHNGVIDRSIRPSHLVPLSPRNVVAWHSQTLALGGRGGPYVKNTICTRVTTPGQESNCPAPRWTVSAVERLDDGRQLLGGEDAQVLADGKVVTAEGGYAFAAVDGTLTPLAGDPGTGVVDVAVEPGAHTAWAVVEEGPYYTPMTNTYRIQRATLPGSPTPTPTPTDTPAPAPTDTPTPTPTDSATPVPCPSTTTVPAPTPTKTKKPKKPKHPQNPWHPHY